VSSRLIERATTASLIGAVVFGLVSAVFAGYTALRGVTPADVEAEIRRELPVGSTQDEVFAFLEDIDAEYAREVDRAEGNWDLERRGVPPDTLAIGAILRDTGLGLIPGEQFIQIEFVLDEDGLLETYYLDEGSSLI
jgi:hypothetical protein